MSKDRYPIAINDQNCEPYKEVYIYGYTFTLILKIFILHKSLMRFREESKTHLNCSNTKLHGCVRRAFDGLFV